MIQISVIIPTFNRSKSIGYCIESILNQTYRNFEVIVVDDCSTDNTVEVIERINDTRIRIIKLDKNSGAQFARNLGIRNARYDWIAFQDSDDEWLPDKLEKQVKELEKVNFNPFTVVHGKCIRYYSKDERSEIWNLPIIDGSNVYPALLKTPSPMFPSILTSKMALEKINYLDEKVPSYQEWDTSIRLAKICRFIHIREPLFKYYLQGDDTISKDIKRDLIGYQYILNKFKEDIIQVCGDKTWQNHLNIQINKLFGYNLFSDKLFDLTSEERNIITPLLTSIKESYSKLSEENKELERRYKLIKNSLSFKIGSFITRPLRIIR